MFFLTGDKGACELNPNVKADAVYITHWGLTVPWAFMGREAVYEPTRVFPMAPCHNVRGVAAPPYLGGQTRAQVELWMRSDRAAEQMTYKYQLSFAGSIWGVSTAFEAPTALANDSRTWPKNPHAVGVAWYSQRVRQLVYLHHRHRDGFLIQPTAADGVMSASRFCLAPSGDGWGIRLVKVILSGCVPLIIQPSVALPFNDILNYTTFALILQPEDIPNLHTILAQISPQQHTLLRMGLERNWKAFSYDSPGIAYDLIVESLRRRALTTK